MRPVNFSQPVEVNDLLSLKNLQHISLDMQDLSDQLLVGLTSGGRAKLAALNVNLHKHEEGVRQIRDRTWQLVHQRYFTESYSL